jgi:hypothetical protein
MAASDLTTFSAVNAWLASSAVSSQSQVEGLITSISRAIYSGLQRPNILPMAYAETLNGNSSSQILLKNWPVISLGSVTLGTMPLIPAPNAASYGYILEPVDPTPPGRQQNLYFRFGRFHRGLQNVAVSYSAGYQTVETQTIAAGPITALQPYGAWASDQGVAYASGAALSRVASAPAQGQYATNGGGGYTFNAADNGAAVTLTYGFLPADLAQACIEWTAARFKAQQSIGVRSKSLGGQEVISYDTGPMPDFVARMIQPFKRVTMC